MGLVSSTKNVVLLVTHLLFVASLFDLQCVGADGSKQDCNQNRERSHDQVFVRENQKEPAKSVRGLSNVVVA